MYIKQEKQVPKQQQLNMEECARLMSVQIAYKTIACHVLQCVLLYMQWWYVHQAKDRTGKDVTINRVTVRKTTMIFNE